VRRRFDTDPAAHRRPPETLQKKGGEKTSLMAPSGEDKRSQNHPTGQKGEKEEEKHAGDDKRSHATWGWYSKRLIVDMQVLILWGESQNFREASGHRHDSTSWVNSNHKRWCLSRRQRRRVVPRGPNAGGRIGSIVTSRVKKAHFGDGVECRFGNFKIASRALAH